MRASRSASSTPASTTPTPTSGGPGTAAAYEAAHANETAPADPALFGPNAPRVKGGADLVGDDYNADPGSANYQPVPHPDANPLDCQGHGSHVAGTAAGGGVNEDGTSYTGPYNTSTPRKSFKVGPGVAPRRTCTRLRVFGCEGSTDVVTEAIDWAVAHKLDVINMSLGSSFGTADDSDSIAAQNAQAAGVVVVASAGNAGRTRTSPVRPPRTRRDQRGRGRFRRPPSRAPS